MINYDELPDVLTAREVMTFLRLGRNATYAALQDGTIRSVRLGQKFLVPKTALKAFLDGNDETRGTGTPMRGRF